MLRPSDYGRCTSCNKLCEKASLKPGPEGGMVGPECLKKVLNAWAESEKEMARLREEL